MLRSFSAPSLLCAVLVLGSVAPSSRAQAVAPPLAFEVAKLVADDDASDDRFGSAVGLWWDTLAIGSPGDDNTGGSDAGSVYVFTRSIGDWTLQQKLTAADAMPGDGFGNSLTLQGDVLVVGAAGVDVGTETNAGAAYVFTRAGSSWTQQVRLTDSDPDEFDAFGGRVALDGDALAVSASLDTISPGVDAGSVTVFRFTGGSWSQEDRLTASDAADDDRFGSDVALEGSTLVVGASSDDHDGIISAGSAYVFTRAAGTWTERTRLTANDAAMSDIFGEDVALSAGTLLVSASRDDHDGLADAGSVYVFTGGGAAWTQVARLSASDAQAGDRFGSDVALSGGTAVIGASRSAALGVTNRGALYLMGRSGSTWLERRKLLASDGADGDALGLEVALWGNTALSGAQGDDNSGSSGCGSAYAFVIDHAVTPWTNVGGGTAGAPPQLLGTGSLTPGSSNSLELFGALPGSTAHLFIGLGDLDAASSGCRSRAARWCPRPTRSSSDSR